MKPKTPLENKMRNEVRTLRQQEERSALGRMRDWQRHAYGHVDDRMNRYKKLTLNEINDFGDHMKDKIQHEEKAEERKGVSRRNHPHEKNHGIEREVDRLEQQIAQLRNKEANHVQHDMKEGYRRKEANAVMGMRENQAKDEKQIVELTRRLSKKSFVKGGTSMAVAEKKKKTKRGVVGINPHATDSFPGYGTVESRPSELARSLAGAEQLTTWQYVLAHATGLTPAMSRFYEPPELLPEAANAEFQADVFYKTLGVHPEQTRETISRSILRPDFIDSLLKARGTPGVGGGGATAPVVPKTSASVAPQYNSREHIKQLATAAGAWNPQQQSVHNGAKVQMSGTEWETNAAAAHNKGQGWLHAYSGGGEYGPTNKAYHDKMGTNAAKRETLAVSVGNPFAKGERTVMIGVKVPLTPDGKQHMVQHLIWHNNRYIPVVGVDHKGIAIQGDSTYGQKQKHAGNWDRSANNNLYESQAMQHLCEHAALHLPGHVFTDADPANKNKRFVDSHKDMATTTFGRNSAGVDKLIDHINDVSSSNKWTTNARNGTVTSDKSVGKNISILRGVKHGTYEPDSNITAAHALAAHSAMNDNADINLGAGWGYQGAAHRAAKTAGRGLGAHMISMMHQGTDADLSNIDQHPELEWKP